MHANSVVITAELLIFYSKRAALTILGIQRLIVTTRVGGKTVNSNRVFISIARVNVIPPTDQHLHTLFDPVGQFCVSVLICYPYRINLKLFNYMKPPGNVKH